MPQNTITSRLKLDPTLPFTSEGKSTTPEAAPAKPLGQLEPDYAEAYQAWKAREDNQTRSRLLKQVQPVLDTAVYSYAGGGASPAIRSRAKLLAIDAFKSYDPSRGTMKTHLLSQLRRLQREAAQSQQIISIPERVALARRHLHESTEELRDRLGRDPSDLELADHTGLSMKRIAHIRQAKPSINTGSILDNEGGVYSPASQIPGDAGANDAWEEMVYYDLTPIDRLVLDYTLGRHGKSRLSTTEIADKLGVTPGAISQRKSKIQTLLDEMYRLNPLGG